MLTGAREPEAAAWALARGGREVVITLGDGRRAVVRRRAGRARGGGRGAGAGRLDRRRRRVHRRLARRAAAAERSRPRRWPPPNLRRRAQATRSERRRRELRRNGSRAPGGPRMSMPWLAATAVSVAGSTASSAATSATKRSKPDGALETSMRAPSGADLVGVRDAARREEELAGAQRDRLAGHVQRELAAEDVEALVLVAVDVQRRHLAGGHVHVDEAERAAASRGRGRWRRGSRARRAW